MPLLRDPVHHTVPLSYDERNIIDHALFQRLRRIKQTAFLNLIFPGATHDRFSHSVGAMHIAGLLFDNISDEFSNAYGPRSLQPSQKDYFRRLVRMAALLHDVGHGPFSHSLEGVSKAGRPIHPLVKDFLDLGQIPNHWLREKESKNQRDWTKGSCSHEDFSVAIIAKIAEENDGRIGGLNAQDVASLICPWIQSTDEFLEMDKVGPSGKWSLRQVLKDIVSGELDADRMDYLLRDSHYSGVPYGQYDKEMLLGNLIWRPHPKKKNVLALVLRRKALHAFEDFLISRFHMFMQLYSHKTVVAFDVVLENALAELPDFSIEADMVEFLRWSDDWLLRKIIENRSSRWGQHIRDRIPLKHLFVVRQNQQKAFNKFIEPFECSKGTTAWYPSLKTKSTQKENVPKIWWRQSSSFLTRGDRGHYPLFIEEKSKLVPIEKVSLLLKSDYVRRFDMTHVYCLRGEETQIQKWMIDNGLPKDLAKEDSELIL